MMQLARDGAWALALYLNHPGDLNVQVELRNIPLNKAILAIEARLQRIKKKGHFF